MPITALELTDAGLARVTSWLAKVAPGLPVLPVVSDLVDELLRRARAGEALVYRLPVGVEGEGAELLLELGLDLRDVGRAH